MTPVVGIDLHGRHTQPSDAIGIVIGVLIALDDGHPVESLFLQMYDSLLEQGRLA